MRRWIAPFDPNEQMFDGLTLEGAPMPPGGTVPAGHRPSGARPVLSRLLYGAQTSLIIGVVANGLALLIGTLVGHHRRVTSGAGSAAILMRFTDLMMAFPALLLAICLAAIFQPSLWIVALVIALVNWVQTARVIYTETIVAGRRATSSRPSGRWGRARGRILFRHILPHLLPTIIVWGTLGISTTVLLEATLSLSRHRRAAPDAKLGQHHLREPDLFPVRALAGVHSRRGDHAAGAGVQPGRRRAARRARPDAAGARLMAAYLLRRLIQSALILLGVSFITFFLLYVLPADPVRQIAGRSATAETVENIRQQLGLDQPFIVQYGRYLGGLVQGDLGRSYLQKTEVAELIAVAPACHAAADGWRPSSASWCSA